MKKKVCKFLLPPLITVMIMLIVMAIKGIYPFGQIKIDYYDNMQQVVPIYMHLWDWLHGKVNLFYDWYAGLGTNFAMPIAAFSVLSPFNLLLYLIPRANVEQCLYIFILAKLAFMAETMYIYLDKKFNTAYVFKFLFSLMFALSGFQMQYSSSFMPWMDVVAFLPLIMLSLDAIFNNKSNLWYTLCLALCFIINYYTTTLILMFILILSGIQIVFITEKSKRKECVCKIAIGTILAVGLASFILVPTIMQLLKSQRFNILEGGLIYQYTVMCKTMPRVGYERYQQFLMYANLSLPFMLIIWGIWKYRKEKNIVKAIISTSILMIVPLFVESSNLLLHFGSYVGYNMRYAFIIVFTFISMGCYYSSKLKVDNKKFSPVLILFILISIEIIFITINLLKKWQSYLAQIEYQNGIDQYTNAVLIFIALFVIIYGLFLKFTKKNSCWLLAGLINIFILVFFCFGRAEWIPYEMYQDGNYIEQTNEAAELLNISEDNLNRIKNADLSLNTNYSLVLKRASLSSFTAAIRDGLQSSLWKWGYSKFYIHLIDAGGTIFSDALLNIKNAVTTIPLDSELYDLSNFSHDYYLYNSKYTIPFGVTVSNDILDKNVYDLNWRDLNNYMYQLLSNKNDNLVDTVIDGNQYNENVISNVYNSDKHTRSIDIKVPNHATLYLSSNYFMEIRVNKKPILASSIGESSMTLYPNKFNNNILELGTFQNETVHIEFAHVSEHAQIYLGALDLNKMGNLCDMYRNYSVNETTGKNTLSFNVEGTNEKNVVILPLSYDEGWKVTINGQETDKVSTALGIFTAIELNEGNNEIKMTFTPKGLKLGMIISILSAIVLIVITKRPKLVTFLQMPSLYAFYLIWGMAVSIIFVIPTLCYFIYIF